MGKKKREHIVFDQMLRVRKSISFSKVNSDCRKKGDKKKNGQKDTIYWWFSL